jgi:hypothetical protein
MTAATGVRHNRCPGGGRTTAPWPGSSGSPSPRMAGGRHLHKAGGYLSPPNVGRRSGSPAHTGSGTRLSSLSTPAGTTKILEAEQWLKGADLHEAALVPTTARARRRWSTPSGGSKGGRAQGMRGGRRHGHCPGDRSPFYRQTSSLAPLSVTGEIPTDILQGSPPRHGGWDPHVMRADSKHEEGELPHARHVTVPRLQALSHLRRNRWSKGWTATRQASNCTATVRPFGSIHIRWTSTKEAGPHVM